MSQYNFFERKIASLLNGHPAIKQSVKKLYQRFNYHAFADKDFTYSTHDAVTLAPLSETYGSVENTPSFFGYFDTSPWNQSMDAAVIHELDSMDTVNIVCYTSESRHRVTTSDAWNYQQGSRTQWHPTDETKLLLNDMENTTPLSKVVERSGNTVRRFPYHIQAVNPNGRTFLSLNYERLDRNRPDYGYRSYDGTSLQSPENDGLWVVSMSSGEAELILPLQSFINQSDSTADADEHYVNHALYNPSGDRFVFMHRWQAEAGRMSQLFVGTEDGDREILLDETIVSHYCWLNDSILCVWAKTEDLGSGYHIVDTDSGDCSLIHPLNDWGDGHPSLSPDGRYIVTDTYPDRKRKRTLLLYDRETSDSTVIGEFFEPLTFTGLTRCDLHPRWSPDGTAVSIDSSHSGERRSYVLDVSEIVDT